MSLIENALDLAKRQRTAQAKQATTHRPEPSAPAGHPAEPAQSPHGPLASQSPFDFSKLRQLELDGALLQENRILTTHSRKHSAESAYRMLRTRVMRIMRNAGWNALGIVAAGPGEGKTVTALNLAISIAAEVGQQAVLVDLDLRRPNVNKYLGIANGEFADVSDFLEGKISDIESLLVSPGIPRLACILNARPLARSSDLLASAQGRMLVDGIKHQCPGALLVFDLPPLLSTDDALVAAPLLDALLFVVAEKGTQREEITAARQLLQEFNVIGTVLNKSIEHDTRADYY